MSSIAIVTQAFPFYPGEQFLEDEIAFWSGTSFETIYLLPGTAKGNPRRIPRNVNLNVSLATEWHVLEVRYALRALSSRLLLREFGWLLRNRKLNFNTAIRAVKDATKIIAAEAKLTALLTRMGQVDVIYCYWNGVNAYAACLVKRRGYARKVISRAHGTDLYIERRDAEYMPFKWQFVSSFDRVFSLSSEGASYLRERYAFTQKQVEVSALGVRVSPQISTPTPDGSLHVVSVAFCIPLKRIDKIINALAQVAVRNPGLQLKWTHIGHGPLFTELLEAARLAFSTLKNVAFSFKGTISNEEVRKFYLEEQVDIFLNASESEGMPVSIMEAMGAGVPAIAPDVGGVSHLVCQEVGYLLSAEAPESEIVAALLASVSGAKEERLRAAARRKVELAFNAENNYPDFIRRLQSIAGRPE